MQALKNRFPNAIFFTTDLDARLFHPAEYEWTRNLVVASGFGLQLNPELQRDIPPFRSAYQTSLFYASLLAITHDHPDRQDLFKKLLGPGHEQLNQARLQQLFKPRIFEIGYSGPVDLSVQDSHLHMPRENPFNQTRSGFGMAVLVLLLLLLYLSSDPVADGVNAVFKGFKAHPVSSFLGFILVAAFIAALIFWLVPTILKEDWWRAEDPIQWFEGISIWPSELLRTTAALLALLFIRKASHDIQNNHKNLAQSFFLPEQPNDLLTKNIFKKTWAGILVHRWRQDDTSNQRDVGTLWQEYLALSAKGPRLTRVVLYVLLFLGFGFLLMELLGQPNHPYRGDFSRWAEYSILAFSVGLMLFLVFWVVDATRLCAKFIQQLSTMELPWGWEKLALLSQRHNVPEDYLGPALKIRLVADQTIVISQLIIYPFIILAIMIVSRLSYFDNWTIPLGLIIIFTLLFIYALACGITLERAAENARSQIKGWLTEKQISVKGDPDAPDYYSEQIQLLIEDLKNIRRGAYVPFIRQPVVRAVLLPFGGVGGIALIDYLFSIFG